MISAAHVSSSLELLEEDVDGDDGRDRRQHALGDHPERDVVIADASFPAASDGLQKQDEDADPGHQPSGHGPPATTTATAIANATTKEAIAP